MDILYLALNNRENTTWA